MENNRLMICTVFIKSKSAIGKNNKKEIETMKVKPIKIEKSCENCVNNVEEYPPHTCDECDSLDNPNYYMWEYRGIQVKNKVIK
jgi:hypothetical protein